MALAADGVMSAGVQFEPGSDEDEGGNDIEIDLVSSDEAEVQTNGCHMHHLVRRVCTIAIGPLGNDMCTAESCSQPGRSW